MPYTPEAQRLAALSLGVPEEEQALEAGVSAADPLALPALEPIPPPTEGQQITAEELARAYFMQQETPKAPQPPAEPEIPKEEVSDLPPPQIPVTGLGMMQRGMARQEEAVEERAKTQVDLAESAAQEYAKTQVKLQAQSIESQKQLEVMQAHLQATQKEFDEARKMARFPGASPEEVDAWEKTVNDPIVSPETRKLALANLAAAREAEIDPNRLFHNMDTGQKILAAFGLVLGGIATPVTGGVNRAWEIMENAIDKDIEVQREAWNRRQGRFRVAGDAFSLAMRMNIDQMSAMKMSKALILDDLETRLSSLQAEFAPATVSAETQQLVGQLQAKRGQLMNDIATGKARWEQEMELEQQKLRMQALGMAMRAEPKPPKRYEIPGLVQVADVPDSVIKDVMDKKGWYDVGLRSVLELQRIRDEKGAEFLERWWIARGKQWATTMRDVVRQTRDYGARFEAGEEEMINALIAVEDVGDIGFILDKLEGYEDVLKAWGSSYFPSHGFRLAE